DLHLPPDGTGPAGVDRPVGQRVVHDDARAGRPVRIPFAGAGFQLGAGVSVLRLTGNQSAISPARTPDSCNVPAATASVTVSSPVASRSQVRGSVSTTFGGFPRLCLVPEMHCTATNGGMRTSTLAPGARAARVRAVIRTAAPMSARGGSGWSSSRSQAPT